MCLVVMVILKNCHEVRRFFFLLTMYIPKVGNKCYAARVNQRYVPLTYTLKTGEQVEIFNQKIVNRTVIGW